MKIARVLLVDDDPNVRLVSQISLEDVGGWEVLTAESGQEALEVAARDKPDVILLDVMMPVMDGPTTFGELRKRPGTHDIPVIFLTAKVQSDEVERFQQLGAIGVLAKPFDPMKLASDIEALVNAASRNRA